MNNHKRGLASADQNTRKRVASQGGNASPTQFKPGDPRTRMAGLKGGLARSNDPDIRSGKLGRKGAKARWGKDPWWKIV